MQTIAFEINTFNLYCEWKAYRIFSGFYFFFFFFIFSMWYLPQVRCTILFPVFFIIIMWKSCCFLQGFKHRVQTQEFLREKCLNSFMSQRLCLSANLIRWGCFFRLWLHLCSVHCRTEVVWKACVCIFCIEPIHKKHVYDMYSFQILVQSSFWASCFKRLLTQASYLLWNHSSNIVFWEHPEVKKNDHIFPFKEICLVLIRKKRHKVRVSQMYLNVFLR